MNYPIASLLALLITVAPTIPCLAQETFVQDEFAIGLWVDPPLDEKADERYSELVGANFTMVIGGFGGPDIQKQVALCEKYGLKLIAPSRGIAPEELPESPAIWGYSIRDEPSAKDFPALQERANAIRAARPGKIAYINLFPDYASAEQLGTATYEEHVGQFIEMLKPEVLSMDHYPRFHPDFDGRDGYCRNLDVFRRLAMEAGIPFWNFFNTMPYSAQTDPTEGQIRWQIYTSLAYGAKGVMYFCYYTPGGSEFPKGGAIITRDDRKTRHYGQARRINAELKNLGPVLMKLVSTSVLRFDESAGDVPAKKLAGTPIVDIARDDDDPSLDLLAGFFEHRDGRRAVLLNNYRFAFTAWPTVTFDTEQVVEIDKATGEETSLIDDSPAMDGIQISLDAGEGRLFLLPPKE